MMKILFVSHYSGRGGANNEMLWLCRELMSRGYRTYVLLPEHGAIEDDLKKTGISCSIVPYMRWICAAGQRNCPKSIIYRILCWERNWRAAWKIRDFARKEKIGLIHTNDSLTVAGAYAARLAKLPHVWHLREFQEEDYDLSVVFPENYIKKWFSESDRMICISDAIQSKYAPRFTRNNYVRIYDGIATETAAFEPREGLSNPLQLLFLGGTSTGKGFEELLVLAELLKNKYHILFRILVAGDCSGSGKYAAEIEKKNIVKEIVFYGFTKDVNKLFRRADVFLMMSHLEAFGLVTVEAMLNGALVLGNSTGGTKEIIENGKTGFLYKENNTEDAGKVLAEICSRTDLNGIREQAYKCAQTKFSIKHTADEVEKVYSEVKDLRAADAGHRGLL